MPLGAAIIFKMPIDAYNEKIIKGNRNNIKNLIVAIAGPFVNFVIAIIVYNIKFLNLDLLELNILETVIYINLLIGFFNLIPIFPLDGGRILKEVLSIIVGKRNALNKINKISNISIIILTIIASVVILLFKNIAIFFIIIYLWIMVIRENKRYMSLKKIYELIEKIE